MILLSSDSTNEQPFLDQEPFTADLKTGCKAGLVIFGHRIVFLSTTVNLRGYLHEKTRTGSSFKPGWPFDIVSRYHCDYFSSYRIYRKGQKDQNKVPRKVVNTLSPKQRKQEINKSFHVLDCKVPKHAMKLVYFGSLLKKKSHSTRYVT